MSKQWEKRVSTAPDPLKDFRKKPIISGGGPKAKYLGRVIVELWDTGEGRDDSYNIAYSSAPVDGKYTELVKRVATALVERVRRDRPFEELMGSM
jgi:hypothetical protein